MKNSIVLNTFNPKSNPHLERMVLFALESLLQTTGKDCEIICADGSGIDSDGVNCFARERGVQYAPSERPEAFAETYNRGCELATGEILVLCASDVFVMGSWLPELNGHLERTGAAMVCPYLSFSDYVAQCYSAPLKRTTFAPCCLTINVNAIRRETWKTVGMLDPSYTGNYNDVDYLIRLRKRGLTAAVADCGLITHLGGATLNIASQLRRDQDQATFAMRHPEFASDEFWHRCWHPLLCKSRVLRFLLRAAMKTAPKHRRMLRVTSVLRFEPLFNRC